MLLIKRKVSAVEKQQQNYNWNKEIQKNIASMQ